MYCSFSAKGFITDVGETDLDNLLENICLLAAAAVIKTTSGPVKSGQVVCARKILSRYSFILEKFKENF